MKTKLLFLLLFVSAAASAQVVNIPDTFFRNKLLQSTATSSIALDINDNFLKVDANSDGQIQLTEAQSVYKISLIQNGVLSLTGITSFTNMQSLYVSNSSALTTLNLSGLSNLVELTLYNNISLANINLTGLTSLQKLQCSYCDVTSLNLASVTNLTFLSIQSTDITSINLSPLINLQTLILYNNELTSINVSMLSQLQIFSCSSNNLTSLSVSGLQNLTGLSCDYNQITQLNVSNCPALATINCRQNAITSLNLTEHDQLTGLICANNPIAQIDVSTCPLLTYLFVNNTLITTLDLRAQSVLNELYISNCPNLATLYIKNGHYEFGGESPFQDNVQVDYICADEAEIPQIQALLADWGTTGVVVNSFCPLAPAADFNVITGVGTIDSDNNGCSAADAVQQLVKFKINDGTNQGASFTNTLGSYSFLTGAGTFTVAPEFENNYFTVTPASAVVTFPVVDGSVVTKDFCIAPNGVHRDLEVVLAPIAPARPGFDATYKLVFKNKGNQVLSGSLALIYQEPVLDFVSASNADYTALPGVITWNYTGLMPFESRSITVTLNVNSSQELPAVNNGDLLSFTVAATLINDETPADNTFMLDQTVVGSYDPNNIICLEGATEPLTSIGKYLHYMVNFENTGTFQAEKVELKLTIDTTKFDINSLQILDHSHPIMYGKVTGNIISFLYDPIYLQATDHGNILFKIKSNSQLTAGATVSNQANIYFDFNAPVATNTANTTFQTLSSGDFVNDESVAVYPNPSNGMVNIKASTAVNSVQLYDVQGRLLQSSVINAAEGTISIAERAAGIYFLKISTDKGVKVEKLIKQ